MRYDYRLSSLRLGSNIYLFNTNVIQETIFMHTIFLDEDNTLTMGEIFNLSFLDLFTWYAYDILAISSVPGYCVF